MCLIFIFVAVFISQNALLPMGKMNTRLTCTNSYGKTSTEISSASSLKLFNQRARSRTPFHAYVHLVTDYYAIVTNTWRISLLNVLQKLYNSQNMFSALTIAVVGLNNTDNVWKVIVETNITIKNIQIIQLHTSNEFGQYPTLNYMQQKATEMVLNKMQVHFVYIPLTGSSNIKTIYSGGILENRTLTVTNKLLSNGYDIVGTLPKNDVLQQSRRDGVAKRKISEHWHYAGYGWWATAKFISTLPQKDYQRVNSSTPFNRATSRYYLLSHASSNNRCAGFVNVTKHKYLRRTERKLRSSSYSGKMIQFYPVNGQAIQGQRFDEFYLLRNNRIHQIPDMDTYHMLNSSHDIFYAALDELPKYELGVPITPYLKTYTNNDKVVSYLAKKTVTVSYVMYSPVNSTDASHAQCLNNLEFFLLHGIVGRTSSSSVLETHPNIQYIFTLVGNTLPTESLKAIARKYNNVEIINHHSVAVDLFPHGSVLRKYNASDFNVFLNCGSRGPYYQQDASLVPTVEWLYPYFDKMVDSDVKLVGSSINCDHSVHVQSYALFTDRVGADIIAPYWQENNKTKLDIIFESEIGISTAVLNNGYNIADMTGRFTNHDFRVKDTKERGCEATNVLRQNPTSVYFENFISLHPCKVIFAKYGGDVFLRNVIPPLTGSRINTIDKQKHSVGICQQNLESIVNT